MDILICNKCFVPIYRGKQPYSITQCAHIFCQECLQHAEKQCPQCGFNGAISIPLKEPLIPKVAPFFVPLAETLELLLKVDVFRNNQMKITMQRFRNLDKKYEFVKTQYLIAQRNMKILTEKYTHLKAEKEKLAKKLMISEMHRDVPSSSGMSISSVMKTPMDSGIFIHTSSTGFSSDSMGLMKSGDITPMRSLDWSKQYKTSDGFRVPGNRRPPKSTGSINTPNYNFM